MVSLRVFWKGGGHSSYIVSVVGHDMLEGQLYILKERGEIGEIGPSLSRTGYTAGEIRSTPSYRKRTYRLLTHPVILLK